MKSGKIPLIKKIIRYTTLTIVVLFTALLIHTRFIVKDIPPVDDSLMDMNYPEIPVLENAYPVLMMAEIPMNLPSYNKVFRKELEALEKLDKKIEKSGNLSKEDIEMAAQRFKIRFDLMDRAVELPYSQAPRLEEYDEVVPNYLPFTWLLEVRLMMALDDFRGGNKEDAYEIVKKACEVGRILEAEDGNTYLISYMVGMAAKRRALTAFNIMLSEEPANDVSWRAEGVPQICRRSSKALLNSIRTEYYLNTDLVLDKYKGGGVYRKLGAIFGPGEADFLYEGLFGWTFKKERARRHVYNYSKKILDNADRNFKEMDFEAEFLKFGRSAGARDFTNLLKGELAATFYAAITTPNFSGFFTRSCEADFMYDATRMRLAIIQYKKEKRIYPNKLDDLTPDYIDEIPIDRFDGKPIRYDPERKILYSVGQNLIDDGGAAAAFVFERLINRKQPYEQKDLVVKLEP